MVYIHTKKTGNKNYYSLRKTVKKGDKIFSQVIFNLGSDLSEVNFKKLEKKYPGKIESVNHIKKIIVSNDYLKKAGKKIIKPDNFFNEKQINEIEAVLIHYKTEFKKKSLKKRPHEKICSKFIKENISMDSIETNFIAQSEIIQLLEKGIAPKNRPVDQIYKVINTKKILDFLEKENPPINLDLIEKIADTLLEGLFRIRGFRKDNIRMPGGSFKVSKAKNVKSDLELLLKWYENNKTKIHPLALTILFHNKFEKIHPLIDRNGDVGRILMNYQLSQFNYPPIIINQKYKEEYYKTMNRAYDCLKEDLLNIKIRYYKSLMDFMQKCFVKTYWDNFYI